MNQLDRDKLLNELLTPDGRTGLRERSLQQGLVALRRERRKRQVVRAGILLCLPLLIFAAVTLGRGPARQPKLRNSSPEVALSSTPRINTSEVKIISDEELFALFPGRSLALIGKPGHQRLVFLDQPIASTSEGSKPPEAARRPRS